MRCHYQGASRNRAVLALFVIFLCTAVLALPRSALAQGGATGAAQEFNITAGPLAAALTAFGEQSGLQISYDPALASGRSSPGVSGSYTPSQALSQLVSGSGLTYRFIDPDTVTLEDTTANEKGDGSIALAPVTVTATRFATSVRDVPRSVFVYDRQDLEKQPTYDRDVQEALGKFLPGASLSDPTGSDPQIRGRPASFRINGIEINRQSFASDIALQDFVPGSFGAIDVTLGANSTYGFGAPGGVINFATPSARSGPIEFESTLGVQTQPENWDESLSPLGRQSISGSASKNLDFNIGVGALFGNTAFDPDGEPLPDDGTYPYSNSEAYDFNAHVVYRLDGRQRLETRHFVAYTDRDPEFTNLEGDAANGIRSPVVPYELDPDAPLDDPFQTLYVGTLTYRHQDLFGSRVEMTPYHSRQDRLQAAFVGDEEFGQLRGKNRNTGVLASVETPLTVLDPVLPGTTLSWGFDFENNVFTEDSENTPLGTLAFVPEQTTNSYAGFAQFEVPLSNSLLGHAGVRHEYYDIELEDEPARDSAGPFTGGDYSFDQPLFNAGLVYYATSAIETYANFSQAAVITDLGRGSFLVDSAADLDPEPAVTDQYELGIRGNWTGVRFNLAAFYSESDLGQRFELIGEQLGVATPFREPIDIWGGEAAFDWKVSDSWRVGGSATYNEGTRETDGNEIDLTIANEIVPGKFVGYAQYAPTDWALAGIQTVHQLGASADAEAESGSVDEATFIDLFSQFKIGPGTLFIDVENLFNRTEIDVYAQANLNDFGFLPFRGRLISAKYQLTW